LRDSKRDKSRLILPLVGFRLRPAAPPRLKEYELQFTFHSDGWFLLHRIVALLKSGKLLPPTEGQKKMLTTLIVANR
jgi:hypothetical protein